MANHQYYGADWDEIKKRIKEDHGGECLLCGSEDELHVHHIEPIKNFDDPDDANADDNLVPLCQRCHMRVETIQNPHTRRALTHFVEELQDEGLPDLGDVIPHVCHRTPSGEASLSTCDGDDCYYPVKIGDYSCPSCGKPIEGNAIYSIQVGYYICRSCGGYRWGEGVEPPEPHNCKGGSTQEVEFVEMAIIEGDSPGDVMEYRCSRCGDEQFMFRNEMKHNSHGCPEPGYHHTWVVVEGSEA